MEGVGDRLRTQLTFNLDFISGYLGFHQQSEYIIIIISLPLRRLSLSQLLIMFSGTQGGITCEAINEPRNSSKAIDKRVIIDFCDKNVVIARFRDKNEVFI